MADVEKKPIVEQCDGCDNIEQGDKCKIWVNPAAKWRLGTCPSATHVKVEAKQPEQKVRVGQQKQKKKGK
ncbi:MAG: PxxKW family cysteine-rich protein [Acidobacteriota bacterium]